MRILITGSQGQLAHDLEIVLSRAHHELMLLARGDLDVTIARNTIETVRRLEPELVIHTAAYTDVDGCEQNPDKAFSINAIGTRNVAIAAEACNAKIAYVSTDFVFDGHKSVPYTEFDPPNPLNVYGRSKLAGEAYVANFTHKWFIIRTSWLYGHAGRRNFVKAIIEQARAGEVIRVVDDQVGSPTYSMELATAINKLIETDFYGLYHISNDGQCSWFEFAQKILEYAGVKNVALEPIASSELNRPATRPKYSVLRNYCLELTFDHSLMSTWESALALYFETSGGPRALL